MMKNFTDFCNLFLSQNVESALIFLSWCNPKRKLALKKEPLYAVRTLPGRQKNMTPRKIENIILNN